MWTDCPHKIEKRTPGLVVYSEIDLKEIWRKKSPERP